MWVSFEAHFDDVTRTLLFDPETSGGLLIAVESDKADALLDSLAARRIPGWRIGYVEANQERIGHIHVAS